MTRTNLVLAVLAGLQLIVLVAIRLAAPDAPVAPTERPLLAFDPQQVRRVELTSGDESSLVLEKRDDRWVLAAADDYPADDAKVEALLADLEGLTVKRAIIRTEESLEPAKVADDRFERRVTLTGEGGRDIGRVYLARGSSSRGTVVREGGETEAFETDAIDVWRIDTGVSSWIDTGALHVEEDEVTSFDLKVGEAPTMTFERLGEDEEPSVPGGRAESAWRIVAPETAAADSAAVRNALDQLATLDVGGVHGRTSPEDAGLESPAVAATLRLKDGTSVTIAIGGEADTGTRWLKSSESEWFVQTPSWSVSSLLDADLDGFRAKDENGAAAEDADESLPAPPEDATEETEAEAADEDADDVESPK